MAGHRAGARPLGKPDVAAYLVAPAAPVKPQAAEARA